MSYVQKSLLPGETVAAVAKLHWLVYAPAMGVVGLGLLVLVGGAVYYHGAWIPGAVLAGLGVLFLPSAWLKTASFEFAVTNQRLIVCRGFLSRQTREFFLARIEEVMVEQSIMGRLFGYGTLIVAGTGGDRTLFPDIAQPLVFRAALQTQIMASRSQTGQSATPPPAAGSASLLVQLKYLADQGVITPEEFAEKKKQLLARMD